MPETAFIASRALLEPENKPASAMIVERADLQGLFDALLRRGFALIGPTVRDSAVVYDEIDRVEDLPIGWTDEQSGGTYRLQRRDDAALFGYTVGPHSWKKYLHPPVLRLWSAHRADGSFKFDEQPPDTTKRALIGVRACEIKGIAIQDGVFLGSAYADPNYAARRENLFIVAVNCGKAGGTCFCVSMDAGPRAGAGYDLALTEVLAEGRHYFVVEAGSEAGAEVLSEVVCREARAEEVRAAEDIVAATAANMGRSMDTTGLKELLYRNTENPRWDEIATRCLSCTNCTMVCPTCFCTTVEDVSDLTGTQAERWRRWDSCFTVDFSYIHGGSVRNSPKSRYRQWMTHKLASWVDQFGTMGCVGCGRCITWCPVGIDITEEARVMRQTDITPGVVLTGEATAARKGS